LAYVLIPAYRQRQRYTHYLPISIFPDPATDSPVRAFVSRSCGRVLEALPYGRSKWWQRRDSGASVDSMFGDEELEEGFDVNGGVGGRTPLVRTPVVPDGRRLSRELEAGFRDDSDEEEADVGGVGGVEQRGREARRIVR
jgi:hypothetical protein